MSGKANENNGIEPPEIRPITSDIKEKCTESEDWRLPRGAYWSEESLIALNLDDCEQSAQTVNHEYMHHILSEFVGREADKKFDESGLGYYLDHYLFPEAITCLYCKHYIPPSRPLGNGTCEKDGRKVRRFCERCPDKELHPIYKELSFYEFDSWMDYRRRRSISSLYKLTESDNDKVREYYLRVLKKRADFYRDPDRFRSNCKKLGGECVPPYCKEECSDFEEGKPEIFSYLEEREGVDTDEYSTPVENSEEAI